MVIKAEKKSNKIKHQYDKYGTLEISTSGF